MYFGNNIHHDIMSGHADRENESKLNFLYDAIPLSAEYDKKRKLCLINVTPCRSKTFMGRNLFNWIYF